MISGNFKINKKTIVVGMCFEIARNDSTVFYGGQSLMELMEFYPDTRTRIQVIV